jgi:hypothetical protein
MLVKEKIGTQRAKEQTEKDVITGLKNISFSKVEMMPEVEKDMEDGEFAALSAQTSGSNYLTGEIKRRFVVSRGINAGKPF